MTKLLEVFRDREAMMQFIKVGLVGVVNTVATFAIFNISRSAGLGRTASLFVAFAVATLMSYVLNRRWSFQLNAGGENLAETWKFFAINGAAWAVTEGLMQVTEAWLGPLSRIGENLALLVISGAILLPKFVGYRHGVFGHALGDDPAPENASVG